MSVQTTYNTEHDRLYAGMSPDMQLCNTVSRLNKGTDNIPYGKGVVTDGDDGAKLPTTGALAKSFNGVVLRELNRAYAESEAFGAKAGYDFTIVTFGPVAVKALEAVSKDDDVYLRIGATGTGDFCKSAGSGATASIKIPNATWSEPVESGVPGVINLGVGA